MPIRPSFILACLATLTVAMVGCATTAAPLIVHAPLPRDSYVVKLFEPVFSLSFKEGLGFDDRTHTGQICNDGDDYLLVPGWQPPEVPIIAVHKLNVAEQTDLLQAAGKPVPQPPTAEAPTPRKN
jgi:hypothetical protein